MKLLSLLFLFVFANVSHDLASVRQNYISAATSLAGAEAFRKSFETVDNGHSNATLVAYKAASIVLMAKYEEGVFAKMRFLNKGKDLLEATIKKAPDNYEARLIRFNIQDNVPWITGYTSNIKEDKAYLIKYFSKQPEDLKLFTQKYVLQCKAFSEKEKAVFKL
jgi:hypothetical protein